jgi:hypothetical protein
MQGREKGSLCLAKPPQNAMQETPALCKHTGRDAECGCMDCTEKFEAAEQTAERPDVREMFVDWRCECEMNARHDR